MKQKENISWREFDRRLTEAMRKKGIPLTDIEKAARKRWDAQKKREIECKSQ